MRTKLHARGLVEVVVFTFVLCGFAWPALAIDCLWNNPSGGLFDVAANWNPTGPPGVIRYTPSSTSQTPIPSHFRQPKQTIIVLSVGAMSHSTSGGNTYSLDHAFIGYIDGQIGKLTLTQGTIEAPTDVGNSAADIGFLTVSTGAVLNSSYLIVGFGGTGTLTVQNGGN